MVTRSKDAGLNGGFIIIIPLHLLLLSITVLYAPYIGSLGMDIERKCSREMSLVRCNEEGSLNHPTPWYPESMGFYVCQIKNGESYYFLLRVYLMIRTGKNTLLEYSNGLFLIKGSTGKYINSKGESHCV